jgi:DNA polymerase V
MSTRVINTLSNIIPQLEIYSIDEAFLDLFDFNYQNLLDVGYFIRRKILKDIGIPVSIGIGRTKTLSKVAGAVAKKSKKTEGVFILHDYLEDIILERICVEQIWGVGKRLSIFLHKHGIHTAKDLKNADLKWIQKKINITAKKMVEELRGIPCMDIESKAKNKKSICTSRTFGSMIENKNEIASSLAMYTSRCCEKLRAQNSYATLAHIFISTNPFRNDLRQYSNFKIIKFPVATHDTGEMIAYILSAFNKIYRSGYAYKKAGVILSGIIQGGHVQENIFDNKDRLKSKIIMKTIDCINRKMGRDMIRSASQGYSRKWKLKQQCLSPSYTTRWSDLIVANVNS